MSLDEPASGEAARDDEEPASAGRLAPVRLREARRRAKISQIVAAEIVRFVVDEQLREGDRLPTESEMLEQFGVGRGSLREALRLLEAYGLISIRQGQNGGPVLATLRAEDVARTLSFYFHLTGATYAELIEARLIIEPVMARLAAERQHPEQMAQLRATTEREQTASLDDPEYLACADEFHYMVSGMSGNRVLDLLGRALRTMFQERVQHGSVLPEESRRQNRKVHRQISDAILAGQGAKAERLMVRHLADLAEALDSRMPHFSGDRITWEG
jgi:GntR family transcriptional regulator, transcriptional repressor for pyruvate dehydrogenase complex